MGDTQVLGSDGSSCEGVPTLPAAPVTTTFDRYLGPRASTATSTVSASASAWWTVGAGWIDLFK